MSQNLNTFKTKKRRILDEALKIIGFLKIWILRRCKKIHYFIFCLWNWIRNISVTINCGGSTSQNITTFQSNGGATAGACNVKIHKISSKIVQLRLDFISQEEKRIRMILMAWTLSASLTSLRLNHLLLNEPLIPIPFQYTI